jgi:hypothetical protein
LGTVTIRKEDGVNDGLAEEEIVGERMILSLLLKFLFAVRDGFVGVLGAISLSFAMSATGFEMVLVHVTALSSSTTVGIVVDLLEGCVQQSGQNQASGNVLMSTLTHSA